MLIHPPDSEPSREIEKIIDSAYPLSQLRTHFPDSTSALTHYGAMMQQKFPMSTAGVACANCGSGAISFRHWYRWSARVNPQDRFGAWAAWSRWVRGVCLGGDYPLVEFETAHGFCSDCARTVNRRRTASGVVRVGALGLRLAGLGLILIGVVGVANVLRSSQSNECACRFGSYLGDGIVLLLLSVIVHRCAMRWQVPASLRWIGRSPFSLAKAGIVADRENSARD